MNLKNALEIEKALRVPEMFVLRFLPISTALCSLHTPSSSPLSSHSMQTTPSSSSKSTHDQEIARLKAELVDAKNDAWSLRIENDLLLSRVSAHLSLLVFLYLRLFLSRY